MPSRYRTLQILSIAAFALPARMALAADAGNPGTAKDVIAAAEKKNGSPYRGRHCCW